MKLFLAKLFKKLGRELVSIGTELERTPSLLIKRGRGRNLYKIAQGYFLWLNDTGYIDQQIIRNGEFESASTRAVRKLVKKGDIVLDVGANIGYYTVMLSDLVGSSGTVYAFEPTKIFSEPLLCNLAENKINNVEVLNFGLSNNICEKEIDIGPSSATMHSPAGYDKVISKEKIKLSTLAEFVRKYNVSKIDFIKIDVDGHEPQFFKGAWEVVSTMTVIILCEVSHLHYLEAGHTAWGFYESIRKHGYLIYDENTFEAIDTKENFLKRCGNFDRSVNIILSKTGIKSALSLK